MHSLSYIKLSEVSDTPLSVFRNVWDIAPKPTTLGTWIDSCKQPNERQMNYVNTVTKLRETDNEAEEKALKLSLPAVMVGATVNTREKTATDVDKIASITGFTQVDIDMKDNKHLSDAAALRDAVARIVYVAFAGLSASGRGVWALVKVAEPGNIVQHFEQLCRDFDSKGIKLDRSKGRNPTDLRIYSFDADAIIKERFALYNRKYTPPPKIEATRQIRRIPITADSIFKGAETFATNRAGAFTVNKGNRHNYIDNLCYYLNRHGITQQEAEAYINTNLMSLSDIKSNCITHSYKALNNLFGTWQDSEPEPRIYQQPPPTDITDTTPTSKAMRSARPTIQTKCAEAVTQASIITTKAELMPIDWAQLEQPEPWEINPF